MRDMLWQVSHPEHDTLEIRAPTRLKALYFAAKHWNEPYGQRLLEKSQVEWKEAAP